FRGPAVLQWKNLEKTLEFILLAPLIGLVLGSILMFTVFWLFRNFRPQRVDRTFRVGQLLSAAAYSIGHGGNDAQKTIGVIWAVMIAGGTLETRAAAAPTWVVVASYSAMAFGTAIGGWRIVKTMGMGLTHLKPVGGFCAEVAGAITLFTATYLKIPVSTTHTITGAIIGVGSVTKARGIRWALAARIVWAWVFTIPAAAAVGALAVYGARKLGAL
ncbi:MAG TPA: inorganic phosphate transporter, partial [Kofleriaceae bacterium]|nr:inorganic phosphate transporter [Kofleriaceae bacterium]